MIQNKHKRSHINHPSNQVHLGNMFIGRQMRQQKEEETNLKTIDMNLLLNHGDFTLFYNLRLRYILRSERC